MRSDVPSPRRETASPPPNAPTAHDRPSAAPGAAGTSRLPAFPFIREPLVTDDAITNRSADAPASTDAVLATAAPWAEIRAAYEGSDLAVAAIAEAYGVPTDTIYGRAKRGGWHRRRPRAGAASAAAPLDRNLLIGRLFKAVERQIAEVERRFEGSAPPSLEEKDARTLGALARTLELLIGLEKQATTDGHEPEPDIDEFRLDLARRLESLRRAE